MIRSILVLQINPSPHLISKKFQDLAISLDLFLHVYCRSHCPNHEQQCSAFYMPYHHHLLCCLWALEMHQVVSHNKGEQQLLVGTVSQVMWMYFLFALVQQVHSISSQPPNLTGIVFCSLYTHPPLSCKLNFTNSQNLYYARDSKLTEEITREKIDTEGAIATCTLLFLDFPPKRKIFFLLSPHNVLTLD